MCGICGVVDYSRPPDVETVATMTHLLRHRGPDDCGTYVAGPVALGHTRLSILDLSATGHQPMFTADGRIAIVYNGETYNCLEIRRRLEAEGVRFRGHSDTEVVLEALARWASLPLRCSTGCSRSRGEIA